MNWRKWGRELYFATKLWIPLIALLAWFWFWFQFLGIRSPGWVALLLFFNPFTFRAMWRFWHHRQALILPYEYMKSMWRLKKNQWGWKKK